MEEVGRAVACVKELEDHVAGLRSTHGTLEDSLSEANHSIQIMTKTLQQSGVQDVILVLKFDNVICAGKCSLWDICVAQVYPHFDSPFYVIVMHFIGIILDNNVWKFR